MGVERRRLYFHIGLRVPTRQEQLVSTQALVPRALAAKRRALYASAAADDAPCVVRAVRRTGKVGSTMVPMGPGQQG
ncbi:hypothetical protein LAM69_22840, partial [Mycobacterium tuberculosis]|nr:hypothetical protein [Mycobacterium tuberculosis]